jgi:Ca2+/Na+ antiporter
MNLQDTWNEIQSSAFEVKVFEKDSFKAMIHSRSQSQMAQLAKKVNIKIGFIIAFIILFLGIMPFLQEAVLQILLLVLTLAYVIGLVLLWQERKELKREIPMDGKMLESLKAFHQRVRNILRYEELIGLFLYPISMTAGFLLGFSRREREISEVFAETHIWMTLVIFLVVATPFFHWLARRMNKIAFGKYLDQLEANIHELESQD